MFLWLGTSKSARRVKGGRSQEAFCPECGETTRFVEVEITEKLQLFSVIDLLDDRERAFRCVECDSVGQIVDSAGALDDLSPEAAARLERARAEAERERRERQRREHEARAEADLAALKARMGLAPEPDPEPPRRRWWQRRKKS